MAGQLPKLAVVALGGAGGDLAYAVASGGALSVVSAASSLYPLATIALGVALQGQRPTRVQLAGIRPRSPERSCSVPSAKTGSPRTARGPRLPGARLAPVPHREPGLQQPGGVHPAY
jgi:hypothetical protein